MGRPRIQYQKSYGMDIIGYWITELRDEAYCAPQELVGEMPREIRNCVAEYLDAGVHCIQYGGCSWCRFHCGKPSQEMGSGERTDGRWVWPDGLSHYVRDHGIILPDEFVSHVLQQSRKARSIRLKTVSLASRLFGSKEAKPRELSARVISVHRILGGLVRIAQIGGLQGATSSRPNGGREIIAEGIRAPEGGTGRESRSAIRFDRAAVLL
jgi:hypothetical protein